MTSSRRINKLSASLPNAAIASVRRECDKLRQLIAEAKLVSEGMERIISNLSCPGQTCSFSGNLKQDRQLLDIFLRNCGDVIYRNLIVGGKEALAIHQENMSDEVRVEKLIGRLQNVKSISSQSVSVLINTYLMNTQVSQVKDVAAAAAAALRGSVLVIIDGLADALVFNVIKYPKRPVGGALREGVLTGPYDGFNETFADNLVLIRRRAPDPDLKVVKLEIGERSHTKVGVLYVDGLVKTALVEEVLRRLNNIKIDRVLLSGEIKERIVDSPWSPFPQVQITERPDKLVAALYEGRVAIMVDNTPSAMVVPCNYNQLLQASDDYEDQPIVASLIRLSRHVSVLIAIFTPGLYVAVTSYQTGVLPDALAMTIAQLKARSPFPSFLEALIMELILELFQEAAARLPDKIVVAASVVGGFVIGNTVVEAGIANPFLVVVIAIAAIASYTIPSYSLNLTLRWFRVPVMLMASVFGLYGVVISAIFILIHMEALTSFGESFFGPIYDVTMLQDWKDMLVRFPGKLLRARPKVFGAEDRPKADDDGN